MAWSRRRGPRLENSASRSRRSTAPTVSAASAEPGAPMVVRPRPVVAGARRRKHAGRALSALTARLSGSVPLVGSPPRLMFTTRAPCATAHSMPAMITRTDRRRGRRAPCRTAASRRTPRRGGRRRRRAGAGDRRRDVRAVAVAVGAAGLSVKFSSAATCPARSGWWRRRRCRARPPVRRHRRGRRPTPRVRRSGPGCGPMLYRGAFVGPDADAAAGRFVVRSAAGGLGAPAPNRSARAQLRRHRLRQPNGVARCSAAPEPSEAGRPSIRPRMPAGAVRWTMSGGGSAVSGIVVAGPGSARRRRRAAGSRHHPARAARRRWAPRRSPPRRTWCGSRPAGRASQGRLSRRRRAGRAGPAGTVTRSPVSEGHGRAGRRGLRRRAGPRRTSRRAGPRRASQREASRIATPSAAIAPTRSTAVPDAIHRSLAMPTSKPHHTRVAQWMNAGRQGPQRRLGHTAPSWCPAGVRPREGQSDGPAPARTRTIELVVWS